MREREKKETTKSPRDTKTTEKKCLTEKQVRRGRRGGRRCGGDLPANMLETPPLGGEGDKTHWKPADLERPTPRRENPGGHDRRLTGET